MALAKTGTLPQEHQLPRIQREVLTINESQLFAGSGGDLEIISRAVKTALHRIEHFVDFVL